jgi:cytochrome P450
MTATISTDAPGRVRSDLIGEAPPSPSGPAPDDGAPLNLPPALALPRGLTALRFSVRQVPLLFKTRRELGETFALRFPMRRRYADDRTYFITHPDHVRSVFTAPELAISTAGESPLRPIVGPNSVLTTVGPTHMRQRKLLLPPFHGEAVERYTQMIAEVAEREIDAWPIGERFALAPRMQAVTLDVIMAGIFGVEGECVPGTPEHGLRTTILKLSELTTRPIGQVAELMNIGRDDPVGIVKPLLARLDREMYGVIAAARADEGAEERTDILSLLLAARDERDRPLDDEEVRDHLVTLIAAGHETTAGAAAWAVERLARRPEWVARLREGDDAQLDAVARETLRVRPVLTMTSRKLAAPLQVGDRVLPAGVHVAPCIYLVHRRPDVYPDPEAWLPGRWLGEHGRVPDTAAWIPFGGGVRRCIGASFAEFEMRVILQTILARAELSAPDPEPEKAKVRNITLAPGKGARVRLDRPLS